MKLNTLLILSILMLISCQTFAGFNGLTHHSRANCGNNETISWDWTKDTWLFVNADHIDTKTGTVVHTNLSGWSYTWRQSIVHWGEGRGGWKVHGFHWIKDAAGNPVFIHEELVTDCSIYDGWWDYSK